MRTLFNRLSHRAWPHHTSTPSTYLLVARHLQQQHYKIDGHPGSGGKPTEDEKKATTSNNDKEGAVDSKRNEQNKAKGARPGQW